MVVDAKTGCIPCPRGVGYKCQFLLGDPGLHLLGNESVPIQLAESWFPGLAMFNAEIQIPTVSSTEGKHIYHTTMSIAITHICTARGNVG